VVGSEHINEPSIAIKCGEFPILVTLNFSNRTLLHEVTYLLTYLLTYCIEWRFLDCIGLRDPVGIIIMNLKGCEKSYRGLFIVESLHLPATAGETTKILGQYSRFSARTLFKKKKGDFGKRSRGANHSTATFGSFVMLILFRLNSCCGSIQILIQLYVAFIAERTEKLRGKENKIEILLLK
jgi:hypothetical protein